MKWMVRIVVMMMFMTGWACLTSAEEGSEYRDVEEVVVTATRIPTPVNEVGNSVTVITSRDLRQTGKPMIIDALRSVPGIDVVGNGGLGKTSFIFIRGAKAGDTLVLIDGIEANDPMSPDRTFDFANLTVDNVERIEILKGPQSTLYGSDAMAGVINIITNKGKGPFASSISLEYGSFETWRGTLRVQQGTERADYALSVSAIDTGWISAASEEAGNSERDGYRNITLSSKANFELNKSTVLSFVGRFIDGESDIDDFGGPGGDDVNHTQDTVEQYYRFQAEISPQGKRWNTVLAYSLGLTKRDEEDDADFAHPVDLVQSNFKGTVQKGEWQFFHNTNNGYNLAFGVEGQEEKGHSSFVSDDGVFPITDIFTEQVLRSTGIYLQEQKEYGEGFFTTLGVRYDNFDRFSSAWTYRAALAYFPGEGTLGVRGSFGTGFKSPTLFQLFSQFGNLDLDPARSRGWDLGVRGEIPSGRGWMEVTYFENAFKNLIDFVSLSAPPFGMYRNVGKAETKGMEVTAGARLFSPLRIKGGYTYLEAKNRETNEQLDRRPRNSFSGAAIYDLSGRGTISLNADYVGKRMDRVFDPVTFATQRVVLGGYLLVNVAASLVVSPNLTLQGRVGNVLNRDYQEVSGFGTPGFAWYVGLKTGI